MEKLKNKASAAKEQANIYKAKIDEKVSFFYISNPFMFKVLEYDSYL